MGVEIRLLGPPALRRDGALSVGPRGQKSWAVLAYLLLAERPVSRRNLAALLFDNAADPLGALRWALAELRRSFVGVIELDGDPLRVTLSPDAVVDVHLIASADRCTDLVGHGELLEGLHVDGSPQFDSWLSVARHRQSAAIEARLRQQAIELLALGHAAAAITPAREAVAHNQLEEGNWELLIRSLAAAGDQAAAARQVAICAAVFERELGVEVSAALHEAAAAAPRTGIGRARAGRGAVISQLEAGRAAIAAGAVDAGLQCLRHAASDVMHLNDAGLRARTLLALGSSLVHAVRGRDEEGAIVLHEALLSATEAGDRETLVTAHRELGFVGVQAGRRDVAEQHLHKADELAGTDAERAGILAIRGMNASDAARYPQALQWLAESAARAASCNDVRQQAWSLSLLARAHLLRGESALAGQYLQQSIQRVQAQRWLAFLPWPQTLHAELAVMEGNLDQAEYELEQAWALACQLGDPCWEAMAARGIGLLHAREGDKSEAQRWLHDAIARCNRVTDRYQWVHGYVLDSAVSLAIHAGDTRRAEVAVAELAALAARCEMPELLARSHLHKHQMGYPGALLTARRVAADIDNPLLGEELNIA